MPDTPKTGTIITFYSSKRGVGQTSAVANLAWLLANGGARVAALDWNLGDPALHLYFQQFLLDRELRATRGLLDFVTDCAMLAATPRDEDETPAADMFAAADITRYAVSVDCEFANGGTLDLIPAGRQSPSYRARARLFDWHSFYEQLEGWHFVEAAKRRLREEYDYVLVDCPSDDERVTGICAVQMPDSLVVCFRLLGHHVEAAAAAARAIKAERPDLPVFPVPMRVERFELSLLHEARERARAEFAPFADALPPYSRGQYWHDVEFPEVRYYSHQPATLAALVEEPGDPTSLLSSVGRLAAYLTDGHVDGLSFSAEPAEESTPRDAEVFTAPPAESRAEEKEAALPVFISYSHKDDKWREKLQEMMVPMVRNGRITVWDDKKIGAGAKWRDEIRSGLAGAKVAVLMVSPPFLASKFIHEEELPPIFEAAENGGVSIFWIAVSKSMYKETYIEQFQSANDPEKPLDSFRSRSQQNSELLKICEKLKSAALKSGE